MIFLQKKKRVNVVVLSCIKTFSLTDRNYDSRAGRACYVIIIVHLKLLNGSCQLNHQCRKPLSLIMTFKLHDYALCLDEETAMTEF